MFKDQKELKAIKTARATSPAKENAKNKNK
jgi:hypothetical protein